ncbi:TPA: hypothetical protein ACH3X1_016083 [Trebouxia sp. C0004]
MDSAVMLNHVGLGSEGSGPTIYEILSDDSETQIEGLVHDRGLLSAFNYAQRFKTLIAQGKHEEALIFFVKTCAASLSCLDLLEGAVPTLVSVLKHAEDELKGWNRGLPLLYKAVKVILVGYQLTYAPEDDQDIHRLIAQAADTMPDFHILMIVHQLKRPDLMWIISLGSFRTAYRLAMDKRSDSDSEVQLRFLDIASYHCNAMQHVRPHHPATLQATTQLQLLCLDFSIMTEQPGLPEDFDPDPMCMHEGYTAAIEDYGDPAQAMQHLLQGMYASLQVCKGKPDRDLRGLLTWAADKVVEAAEHLERTFDIWEHVGDKLVASMLMLGHSWPLAKALDPWGQHPLISFINKQHRIQQDILAKQDLLSQPSGQAALSQEEQGAQEAASASPSKDREEDDGEGASDLRCARCHKRIGKQVDKVCCQECHAAFYCGANCQRQHAELHKGACKRAKLKSKLASKATGDPS